MSTSTSASARLAAAAYVWGLPLVVSTRTVQLFARSIGVDRLSNQRNLSGPGTGLVVAPNVDTLYSTAVLDLRAGPMVLTVPAIHNRYYAYQFLDMYTESFAYVGTRATGGTAGSWVVTPPGWVGTVPTADHVIRAPTPVVFLLGRFLVNGAADLPADRAVMARVQLSALPTTKRASVASVSPLGAPRGAPQDVSREGASFFDELGEDLTINPPATAADRAAVARFEPLGVGPGRSPAAHSNQAQRAVLAQGVTDGAAQVERAAALSSVHAVNGWSATDLPLGRYGDDFILRAVVAQIGWGANIPAEAVYVGSQHDTHGDPYTGADDYVMHFAAGSLPPAKAFWSLTAYAPNGFLVANPTGRYDIGDHSTGLQTNADGSLDLYLQHNAPAQHRSNWLPTPAGAFRLLMRIYLPGPTVLDGSYRLPALEKTR